jgi:polyisoprenoid-binding protein YceI
MNRLCLSVLGVVVLWGGGLAAQGAEWAMDPDGSKLQFVVHYQGEPATGRFRKFATHLRFDPAHPEDGRLQVTVDVASADMDSSDINTAIRGAEWFDVARYAHAEFKSREIARQAPGRYIAHGKLTLKGGERKIAVPFTWSGSGRSASMQGQLALKRTAFNIGTGEWADGSTIGLEVEVRFHVRLHRVSGN